jgi:hypothetical protein
LIEFGDDRLPEMVWRHIQVNTETGCWEWTGRLNHAGYARARAVTNGPMWRIHRLTYVTFVGAIPEGLTIDHLCRVRKCVNPAHLEAVSQRENALRGDTVNAINLAKTHCPQGHPYDDANTYVCPKGRRNCRTCTRRQKREWEQRKRKAA